ncbi:hypothetical protein K439DRAFT_1638432, partial [Ramaria rubella]
MTSSSSTSIFSEIQSKTAMSINTSSPIPVLSTVSHHSQSISPKQFIPVGVLAIFLIVLFFSHLMRYPRMLYVSRELLGTQPHSLQDTVKPIRQKCPSEDNKCRSQSYPRPFSRTSMTEVKPLASFNPHTEAIYCEPTVRLVCAYHNRSPEPRVYLPEEITIPSPSQTLVNSSHSTSTSNLDFFDLPPRVYLPPVLPETEPGFSQQRGLCCTDDYSYTTNQLWAPSSLPCPPGLSGSTPTAPCVEFCDLKHKSSEVPALPFVLQTTLESSITGEGTALETETSLAPSPLLSPPPIAHTQPILVKRALSPWRRRSPIEPSYVNDSFLQMETNHGGASELSNRQRHRPSVPSRLCYFITRSTTSSVSGSQSHTMSASSLGQRSEKLFHGNKQSPGLDTLEPYCSDHVNTGELHDDVPVGRFSGDLEASAKMPTATDSGSILQPHLENILDSPSAPSALQLQHNQYLYSHMQLSFSDSRVNSIHNAEDVQEEMLETAQEGELPNSKYKLEAGRDHIGLGYHVVSHTTTEKRRYSFHTMSTSTVHGEPQSLNVSALHIDFPGQKNNAT